MGAVNDCDCRPRVQKLKCTFRGDEAAADLVSGTDLPPLDGEYRCRKGGDVVRRHTQPVKN